MKLIFLVISKIYFLSRKIDDYYLKFKAKVLKKRIPNFRIIHPKLFTNIEYCFLSILMTESPPKGPNYSNIRLFEYSNENPTTYSKSNCLLLKGTIIQKLKT